MRQINRFGVMLGVLLSVVLVTDGVGAPPPTISYQGRLSVEGVHFDGTGQFKFALVDGGTDLATPATAEATVNDGFITRIDVLDGGAGYVDPPAVTIEDATGTGAEATATVAGGIVTAITVDNAGSDYSPDPTVTLDSPPANIVYASYWSHDGSSVDGSEPDTAIGIPVQHGLYAVQLGDVTVEGMSEALSADVFANSDVRLRVWFDDGEHGFRQLTPDQRVTSVGYALMAADVAGGAWRLGGNAETIPGTHYLGTSDDHPLELRVNGARALRIEPDATSPRIVAGHASNVVDGAGATVSGGGSADFPNRATHDYATVGGGGNNLADGWYSTIGGGIHNYASNNMTTVAGGFANTAAEEYATVGGGYFNTASEASSTVGGGRDNTASGSSSTVGGGRNNTASGYRATISGGSGNAGGSNHATIGGGRDNSVENWYAMVGGGWNNTASGSRATIGGGVGNNANGYSATIGGGFYNNASDSYATIPGGRHNTATNHAFAAGRRAKAIHEGAFVWGDSINRVIESAVDNEVVFRCNGGVRFTSGAEGGNQTVSWAPGAGSWSFSSDRELKEDFAPVDPQTVLDKVATLPISEWNYKGYEPRHIGPMAQDFYAAFPLAGASPTSINSLHLDGVALAAIQGLNQKVSTLEEENEALKTDMARLNAENERLASELEAIKQHLGL